MLIKIPFSKLKNDILLNELTLTIKKIMILKVKLFRSSVRIWYTAHTLVIYSSYPSPTSAKK